MMRNYIIQETEGALRKLKFIIKEKEAVCGFWNAAGFEKPIAPEKKQVFCRVFTELAQSLKQQGTSVFLTVLERGPGLWAAECVLRLGGNGFFCKPELGGIIPGSWHTKSWSAQEMPYYINLLYRCTGVHSLDIVPEATFYECHAGQYEYLISQCRRMIILGRPEMIENMPGALPCDLEVVYIEPECMSVAGSGEKKLFCL